jgi:hypothetical protein
MTTLDYDTLTRWRADPIAFIERVLCDPETGEPFVLSDAERQFLQRAFTLNDNGRLLYPELVFGAIKKSGKTTLAPFPRGLCGHLHMEKSDAIDE